MIESLAGMIFGTDCQSFRQLNDDKNRNWRDWTEIPESQFHDKIEIYYLLMMMNPETESILRAGDEKRDHKESAKTGIRP